MNAIPRYMSDAMRTSAAVTLTSPRLLAVLGGAVLLLGGLALLTATLKRRALAASPRGGPWLQRLPGLGLAAGLAVVSYALAMLPGLSVVGPLTVALLIGISSRTVLGLAPVWVDGTRYSARTVLRLGIVLMGARLDFGLVAKVGPRVLLLALAVIVGGILGIRWVAKRFGVPEKLGTLLAVGTAICGASAVVAASSVTRAEEEDTTLAVGLCGILGTVGVLFYVFAGPLLGLSTTQLAILSGATLHEVAQVMAAAFTWGTSAGDLGTLVKLTRVVLLAPALVALGLVSGASGKVRYSLKEPPIPWFVLGFLAVGVLGSVGVVPSAAKAWLSTASVFLMVMAMAAMGLGTHLSMVRRAGMRVVYAGLVGFAALALSAWGLIQLLSIQ
ncbi:putative sulfate exporter family transporter [Myxococcus stipitatus]|uniref:YeiH family protein n=1 Tax=Myxococcus stipitatus TaxID=83455 RepID=UPI001F26767A|nr:putative sulfate exporter family transporter [Myxococcus stipitatus]MCE9668200.1 putative sulfate exporter family transporter [Myxococcus stipitatus]